MTSFKIPKELIALFQTLIQFDFNTMRAAVTSSASYDLSVKAQRQLIKIKFKQYKENEKNIVTLEKLFNDTCFSDVLYTYHKLHEIREVENKIKSIFGGNILISVEEKIEKFDLLFNGLIEKINSTNRAELAMACLYCGFTVVQANNEFSDLITTILQKETT